MSEESSNITNLREKAFTPEVVDSYNDKINKLQDSIKRFQDDIKEFYSSLTPDEQNLARFVSVYKYCSTDFNMKNIKNDVRRSLGCFNVLLLNAKYLSNTKLIKAQEGVDVESKKSREMILCGDTSLKSSYVDRVHKIDKLKNMIHEQSHVLRE
jgi:hypothetical protein